MKQKNCIIICGPTASGKTDIAINIAKYFNTQIISADSRQCFKELNIGVAKPSAEQLSSIPHHFINSHFINENISAADFEKYALDKIDNIFLQNNIAVIVGGTGLYIKAFCHGLDEIPKIEDSIVCEIKEKYVINGIEWLQEKIKIEDEMFWKIGEIQNPNRMIRALAVIRQTGKSITLFQQKNKKERNFNIIKIAIDTPRDILYNNINARVDTMITDGLLEEVKNLQKFKFLNALQTVGYREIFDYLDNKTDYERAISLIKQNTRHYAKRQITWFKKEENIDWIKKEIILKKVIQKIDEYN